MILKTLPLLLFLGCSTHEGTATDVSTATPGTDAGNDHAAKIAEAERLLAAGQVDEALLITDALLDADSDDRPARLIAARGSIALFQSGRQGAQWFLDDACRHLEAALNQDPEDATALSTLAWCRLQKSEFDVSARLALECAELLRSQKAEPERIAGAVLLAADAQMQIFVAARRVELEAGTERPEDGVVALGKQVLKTLNTAEQLGQVATARVRASRVYRWLDRTKDALQELEVAVRADPSAAEAHDALQQLYWDMDMRSGCVAVYKRLLKEAPTSTAMRWYLGRAQVALGDDLRSKTQWEQAATAYADALATFQANDRAPPGDRAGTSQWLAICELSLGRAALEQGDLDGAREHFFAAFDANPAVAETDDAGLPRVYDSFGGNYLGGLSMIGQALAEQTDANAVRRSLEFFEAILARHPGRFGTIYNNAALSARDLGVQVAGGEGGAAEASVDEATRRARLTEAMELWERSYAHYRKAVELEPDDPRIANDCGLMLIYYLHRDYDTARALCEKAIELGEAQLAALPADADDAERRDLEEAVGDAWQNIGVLLQDELDREPAEWRPFYEKSLQYFPYQRREAAARLRALASGVAQQDPRQKQFDAEIGAAKAAAAEGDYDAALLVIDRMAKEMSGFAPYHYHAGIWSLAFARKAIAEGGNPGLIDGLFADAVRNLERAVELDGEPLEPRLALADALLAKGETARAVEVANDLLSHARSAGGAPQQFLVQVHAIRAEAAARAFVTRKQAGETDDELLRTMRASFREIETTDAFDAQKRGLWVATEQWAGAAEQAVQIVARAWQRDGAEDAGLIGQLVQTGASAGASQPVIDALQDADDPTSLWWRGRAHFDLGVQLWSGGKAKDGVDALDRGIALFEQSMRQNPDFRDTCEQWIALCRGQKGILQISADELDAAAESLLTAAEGRPDMFTADLGGGSSIKRGILVVADRFLQQRDLGRCAAIYRRAGAAVPDDVDIANNEGLFCRDHADQLRRRGSGATADEIAELYEASYAAYTRAAELDPTSVRLRNDRALILVYGLKRELDLAERILKEAIADGVEQLAEDPPEDLEGRRGLEEAVGDAYGNLGVLYMEQKRYPEAREHLTRSLDYYAPQPRAAVRLLPQLDQLEKQAQEGGKKDGE